MPTYAVSAPDGSAIEMDGPQPPTEGQIRAAFLALKNRIRVPPDAKVVGVPGTDVLGLDPLGKTPQGAANVYQKYSGLFNVAGSLKDVAQGIAPKLVQKVEEVAAPYIKAYHGSPYDFEKFDLSKIGTGEGAQAYGHGLYFAENPQTAKAYRDSLAGRIPGGYAKPDTALIHAATDLRNHGYSKDAAVKELEKAYPMYGGMAFEDAWTMSNPGRMYEVAIRAKPEQLLDWDKPLSQQSPQVQQALTKAGVLPDPNILKTLPYGWDEPGRRLYDAAKGRALDTIPMFSAEERAAAGSTALKRAGIPGLQYLDQGSRAAGEGTRNYVIFDDALVSILKKYGIAAPVIEALRQHVMGNQDQNAQ